MPTGQKYHCDECQNFPPGNWPGWNIATVMGKQACLANMPMMFKMPHGHPDIIDPDSWGFFSIPGCKNFNIEIIS